MYNVNFYRWNDSIAIWIIKVAQKQDDERYLQFNNFTIE